jgi:drug/metabolite transporter (DMT)-like permease
MIEDGAQLVNQAISRSNKKNETIADLSLLLVTIVWGSSYAFTKMVLEDTDVFSFLFIRFALTVMIMLLFTWKNLREASKDTWITGTIIGLFLFGIFTSETYGVNYTTAANAGFIISLTVVFTPLVESFAFKKRLRMGILSAVFLSIIGTGLLTLKQGYQFNIGDLLILFAAVLRATQMTFTSKLTQDKEMDSGALTTIQLGVAAVCMGIMAFSVNGTHSITFDNSFLFWLLTGYLAIFSTLFAFYIQLTMIRKTSPTRVGLLMGTEPLFAALFAIFIGNEHLSVIGWIGGLLIIIATYYGRYVDTRPLKADNKAA